MFTLEELKEQLYQEGMPDYALALKTIKELKTCSKKTAYVNCKTKVVYINQNATLEEATFLLRHELLHLILKHYKRFQRLRKAGVNVVHKRSNIASDLEISNMYSVRDLGLMVSSDLLKGGYAIDLGHNQYANMTAEEIYAAYTNDDNNDSDDSEDDTENNDNAEDNDSDDTDESDNTDNAENNDNKDSNGSGDSEEDSEEDSEDSNGSGDSEDNEDDTEDSNGSGDSEDEDDTEDSNGSDENGNTEQDIDSLVNEMKEAVKTGIEELTEEQKKDLSNEIVSTDTERAAAGEQAGGQAEKVEPVEVVLRKKLHRFFKSADAFDMNESYRFYNKKNTDTIRLKGRRFSQGNGKQVGIYIDVSGSMSKERLAKAMGTLKALDRIKNIKKTVRYFGSGIYTEFCNGGGTRYDLVFEDAKKNKVDSLIIITDDDFCAISKEYVFDAIFIIGVTEPTPYDVPELYGICKHIGGLRSDKYVRARYFDCTIVGEK